METSEKLGAKEFVKAAKNSGLEDMLTKKNVTVFLPTDASFTEFSEQMFESVRYLNFVYLIKWSL